MTYIQEIADICVEKYNVLKKLHKYGSLDELFTVETILHNILYVTANNLLELLASIKYLQKWLKSHPNVSFIYLRVFYK